MNEVVVERARPDDAEVIMAIKRAAWLAGYVSPEHGVTQDDIEKKFPAADMPNAIRNWRTGIATEHEQGDKVTYVARLDGAVVGYTSPCSEDGQRRVGALYVAPGMQGKGIGGKLLQRVLQWHGADQDVYARVVAYNSRAISFYEKQGFIRTGHERPEEFDTEQGIKLLADIEMVHKGSAA